jgi:amino acid transporter
MSAVHAGDIKNAKRTIPRAMGFSAIIILLIVTLAPLSIGLVIPQDKISIVAGLIDALQIFFQSFQIAPFIFLTMLALVFVGNIGSTTAWMIGSTRGMHVASIHCNMPAFFQKTNRYHAPLGILILEAIIFTFSCSLFFFSTISNAYWILLQLASQLTLIYYIVIFAAAMKLKRQLVTYKKAFQIPGKTKGITIAAIVASLTALFALILGFVPPSAGTVHAPAYYSLLLILGIGATIAVPFLFLKLAKK